MPSAPLILKGSVSSETVDPSPSLTPSPPSSSSEAEGQQSFFPISNSIAMNRLQHSLAALSESQLRSMVLRIATQDPYFCDVIAMELDNTEPCSSDSDNDSPTTPTSAKPPTPYRQERSKRPRTMSNTFVHFPPVLIGTAESDQEECYYHPGHLETEDYEFLTVDAGGRAYRAIQTVSMWSCCEGEDASSGCVVAPAHTIQTESTLPRHRRTRPKSLMRSATQKRRA